MLNNGLGDAGIEPMLQDLNRNVFPHWRCTENIFHSVTQNATRAIEKDLGYIAANQMLWNSGIGVERFGPTTLGVTIFYYTEIPTPRAGQTRAKLVLVISCTMWGGLWLLCCSSLSIGILRFRLGLKLFQSSSHCIQAV